MRNISRCPYGKETWFFLSCIQATKYREAGPFRILEAYGSLAYKLELPESWKIHSVISVIRLKPASTEPEFYNRLREEGQPPEEDLDYDDVYRLERIVDRRMVNRGRGQKRKTVRQYLLKWKGWGPAHNSWYDEEDLPHAREFIEDYLETYGNRSRREYQLGREDGETTTFA